jgi:hypothetical protein
MNAWRDLVDSVASRGGSIVILLLCTVVMGVMLVHIMHHGDTGESASLIRNSFAAFSGALLMALTTTAKANGKNGSGSENPTQEIPK